MSGTPEPAVWLEEEKTVRRTPIRDADTGSRRRGRGRRTLKN